MLNMTLHIKFIIANLPKMAGRIIYVHVVVIIGKGRTANLQQQERNCKCILTGPEEQILQNLRLRQLLTKSEAGKFGNVRTPQTDSPSTRLEFTFQQKKVRYQPRNIPSSRKRSVTNPGIYHTRSTCNYASSQACSVHARRYAPTVVLSSGVNWPG